MESAPQLVLTASPRRCTFVAKLADGGEQAASIARVGMASPHLVWAQNDRRTTTASYGKVRRTKQK